MPSSIIYSPPKSLRATHDLSQFSCEDVLLDDWLREKAFSNEEKSASRTYVVCTKHTNKVIAFYSLSVGGATHDDVSARVRRNMPNPIPLVLLGRLAVDERHIKKGIGTKLVFEALQKALKVSKIAGACGLLVHARDEDVVSFYTKHGFKSVRSCDPCTLLLSFSSLSSYLSTKK